MLKRIKNVRMASTGIIPTYQRFVNGAPVPPAPKRSFRPREKYLILLVLITFAVVCFCAFFDLPEYKASTAVNNVYIKVYKQLQNAPQLLIPPPPHGSDVHNELVRHGDNVILDPHKHEDRVKLLAKIEQDEKNQRVLERPNSAIINDLSAKSNVVADKSVLPPQMGYDEAEKELQTVQASRFQLPIIQGGKDSDPVAEKRRNKVREVRK